MGRANTAKKTDQDDDEQLTQIETLKGDVRDSILMKAKGWGDGFWSSLSENHQRRIIDDIDAIAHRVVAGALKITASRGFPYAVARVGKITYDTKNGIQSAIGMPYTKDDMDFLCERQTVPVIVVGADLEDFLGERERAEPDNIGDLKLPRNQKPKTDKAAKRDKDAKEAGADPATGVLPDTPAAEQQPETVELPQSPPTATEDTAPGGGTGGEPPAPEAIGDQQPTYREHA